LITTLPCVAEVVEAEVEEVVVTALGGGKRETLPLITTLPCVAVVVTTLGGGNKETLPLMTTLP